MENAGLFAAVRIATDELTDDELAGLCLVSALEQDPRNRPWYDKVASLYTEANGTRMHSETAYIVDIIASQRLED